MGGSEFQVSCIVERLVELNRYDLFYLARRVKPGFVSSGYEVVKVADWRGFRRFGEFLDAPKLANALKTIKPDVIYQRVGCGYTGIAAYYARRSGCKFVWHVAHEMEVEPFNRVVSKNMGFRYIDKQVLEYGIRHATDIIVQTRRQQELLKQHYNRTPTVRIENGHPFPREKIAKAKAIEIVWVANLKPWKQPEVFARLARDLEPSHDVRFTMIGSSAWSAERHAEFLRQIENQRNLTYLGGCTQDEVNAALARAHIFVNTSVHEGFPNTFIQAWMRQVPVVTLNVNPDDVLTDKRIGLISNTYEKMKQDIAYLIENPDVRHKMGADAQTYAFATYSMKNIDKVIEVITV
jgi:glycosyltransferase involved in cell wall biosynthesis